MKKENNTVVQTQQESFDTKVTKDQDPTKVFTVQPKVERKLGDEFTIDDKQVVVVEVNDGEYHVKNKQPPFDSFWI
jgi:hypothetical protein